MKCRKCGHEILSGERYCQNCGTKVDSVFTKEVIQAAKRNDQEAITLLYNETYNNVYQTIKAIMKADEDTVLDLVQDTYIRAFTYLDQLDDPEHFRAWIKRIGANTAKNYLKKKKPTLFSELAGDEEEPQELQLEDGRPENMPEAVMEQKETQRLIGEILDTLSDDQRLAVTMFYFDELSVKEIAEELGCSENTVKSRLSYGRKKIEIKVRELAKKGTKLYGLAPIPFFLFLLHMGETSAATLPSLEVLQAVQAGTVGTAAEGVVKGSAGKSIAGKVASAAVKTGAKAVSVKVVAGITAAVIAVTSAVAIPIALLSFGKQQEMSSQDTPAPVPESSLSESSLPSSEEEESSANEERNFDELLKGIEDVVSLGLDSYNSNPEEMEGTYDYLGEGIVWLLVHRENVEAYTLDILYREYDIDHDGKNEFLLARGLFPSRIGQVIAVYHHGEDPIVGDRLFNDTDFPDDLYDDILTEWSVINPGN